jgi:replicative DNA helicase
MEIKQQLHKVDMENDIIGQLLFASSDLTKTFGFIEPKMFYDQNNQLIYETMLEMYENGRGISPKQLEAYLLTYKGMSHFKNNEKVGVDIWKKVSECEPIGLLDKCIYIRVLYEKRLMEQIRMKPDYESASELIDELARCKEITSVEDWQSSAELIREQIKFIEEIKESGGGLNSGIGSVDFLLSGMKSGELIILAARPGVGKSAFAINIALNIASKGVGVGIISLEMANAQNVSRISSNIADFEFGDLMRGKVTDSDLEEIISKMQAFSKYPIYMSDTSRCKAIDIRAKCMNLIRKQKNIGLIIIDYLQLIERDESRGKSTNDEISKISRSLKLMSKELGVPVLALAQLNREIEKRTDKVPKNSDLRDSGSLEQDADKICFLVPQDSEDNSTEKVVEYYQTKNRNGKLGKCELIFNGSKMRYTEKPKFQPYENLPPKNNFKPLNK